MFDSCLECIGLRSRDKMGDKRSTKGRSAWRRWTTRKRNAENFSDRIISVGKKSSVASLSVEDGVSEESQTVFDANDIKTSKYTIFTFLPRSDPSSRP